MTQEVEGLSY